MNEGLSRSQIIDAADRLIKDHGQENVKAAKTLELILDDMLTNGYTNVVGEQVGPNAAYLAAKAQIDGAQPVQARQAEELPIWDMDVPDDGLGAARAKMLNSDYDNLQMNSQSFYPEGANAARPVDVPTRDAHGNPISKSASTVMGAKAIPDSMIAEIEQLTADRAFSYRSESDRHAIDRANSTIRSAGWEGALDRYRTAIKRGVVSKDIVVLGQTLLNNAANSGDSKTTAEILSLYSSMSVNTGQAMQAMSILRKMSPENQLYGVQKLVDNLNENVSKRKFRSTGGKNSAKTIPVEEWMDRVGEQLADGLARSAGISKTKAQPLTKTILSDLRAFAKQYTETSHSGKNRRSEMDRISDLFHNQEHYQKALDAAKKTVAEKYGENTSVMQALDEWMQSTLDYTEAFTKEVTGQSEIKVSEELIRKFLSQTDQDGRDAVMKDMVDLRKRTELDILL